MALFKASISDGESLTPLTSMISSQIWPLNSRRNVTRELTMSSTLREGRGRLTRRKAAAVAASREGTTMFAARKACRTVFLVRRELLVRTATGISVILLIFRIRSPIPALIVGSPEPEKVMWSICGLLAIASLI
jgi:hypothetical protein